MLKKLNEPNRKTNERTEVYFFVDSSNPRHLKLFSAIDKDQKLLLCEMTYAIWWDVKNFTYPNLCEFICAILKTKTEDEDLTEFIKSRIFKLPD